MHNALPMLFYVANVFAGICVYLWAMVINILAFGIAKEVLGGSTVAMNVDDGITVAGLIAFIKEQHPRMGTLTSFAIAVNGNYVTSETIIKETDEVAIIPPVSGG